MSMHKGKQMFVIPNAWDVGNAYIFEKTGFSAVATSSAGIAYDLGYPDGETITFEDLLYVVKKIADRISVPLSVDFERGYCVFIPGAMSKETVAKLVLNIHAPLNIILNGMFHDFKELNTLGVRRLSVGSGPVRYICEKTIEIAQELYNGNVDNILKSGLTYAKANEYFKK